MPNENINEVVRVAQAINGMLAPAIMISAAALMILALQAKYSQLIDRLRALNDNRRSLRNAPNASQQRMSNVVDQIEIILQRARLIRNSIASLYFAIALFVLSSILIGLRLILAEVSFSASFIVGTSLVLFMIGMVFVLSGVLYAFHDITRAFVVARIEVRGVKELENLHTE